MSEPIPKLEDIVPELLEQIESFKSINAELTDMVKSSMKEKASLQSIINVLELEIKHLKTSLEQTIKSKIELKQQLDDLKKKYEVD